MILAKAFGCNGVRVATMADLTKAIAEGCKAQKKGVTTLVEVVVNKELGAPFRRDAMQPLGPTPTGVQRLQQGAFAFDRMDLRITRKRQCECADAREEVGNLPGARNSLANGGDQRGFAIGGGLQERAWRQDNSCVADPDLGGRSGNGDLTIPAQPDQVGVARKGCEVRKQCLIQRFSTGHR